MKAGAMAGNCVGNEAEVLSSVIPTTCQCAIRDKNWRLLKGVWVAPNSDSLVMLSTDGKGYRRR